ncbi:MAG: four helix bundle protein [Myxococcaceae bacterium]
MVESYYENLPIYKSAMDLVVSLDSIVRKFPQHHKYTLGMELRLKALEILQKTAEANRRETRTQNIAELCDQIESLKILCNVAKEVQAFQSFKQFSQVMEQVLRITRQAEGWRRKSKPRSNQNL